MYKKSFVFIIILLVILSNVPFVYAEEKQQEQNNPELSSDADCDSRTYDTDCGSGKENCKDVYKKGTAHGESGLLCSTQTKTDECVDSNTVKEYYINCFACDEAKSANIDCPSGYGCSNGACVKQSTCKKDGESCSVSNDCCNAVCAGDKICGKPACYKDSDCGETKKLGDPFCRGGKVVQRYDGWKCNSPGEHDASCSGINWEEETNCAYGCSNGKCNPAPECKLTKAYWNYDRVTEGTEVRLTVEGENCDGKSVSFNIWEFDCGHDNLLAFDCDDEPVKITPASVKFVGNKAEGKWVSEWQDDGPLSIPEYYFVASSDSKTIKSYDYDGDLKVDKKECSVTNTQYEKKCDGNNVYWYDNCGGKQSKVQDCSVNACKDSNTLQEKGACTDSSSGAYCSYQNKNCGSDAWVCNGNKEEFIDVMCASLPYDACWSSKTQSNDCGTYGCNSQTGRCNPPQDAVCGNNNREGNEKCDGSDLDGKTCNSFGYNSGILKCANCEFDYSDCKNEEGCGDNKIQSGEECDSFELNGKTCASFGYEIGRLVCNSNCKIDNSDCENCPEDGYNNYECKDNKLYGNYAEWKSENNVCIQYNSNRLVQDCGNSYCTAGSCKNDIIEKVSVEDADSNTRVYKKPGDYINLIINSKYDKEINFNPGNFNVDSGYSNNQLSLKKGENVVKIYIPENTNKGEYSFNIDGKNYRFEVIDNPTLLIVTDRNALFERYNYDTKVYDILAKAHEKADKERGIIYYLDQEDISGRPFNSFSNYNEDFSNPNNLDNSYSLEVSRFIKRKCGNSCNDVILLGDDFVVPHYRRSVFLDKGLFSEEMNYIYSDYPYIMNTYEEISNLDEIMQRKFLLGGIGYPVIIVRPDYVSSELLSSINALEASVKSRWNINSITIQKSSSENCNDLSSLFFNSEADRLNLILIGDETNNKAIACLPFIDNDAEVLMLERNPWNKEGASIIINSMDSSFINMISEMIDKKAYIYYNSPFLVKLSVKSEELVKDCSLVGIIPIIETVGDVCGIVNDCLFDRSWGWCGGSTVLTFVPVASSSHAKILKKIQNVGAPGYKLLKKYGTEFLKIFDFGDFLRLSDSGSNAVIRMVSKLDNFGRVGKDVSRRLIQLVGYYGPDSKNIKNLEEISEFPGSRDLIKNWGSAISNLENPNALRGLEFQAEITSKIKNSNDVKKVINVETIGDVMYETKNGDIVAAEIKRHSAWGIKDISEVETQINKLKIAIDNKQITKGRLLSAFDNVPKDIKDKIELLKKQGYDIAVEVVS